MSARPTFTFFKLIGCGACDYFDREFFQRLITDPAVTSVINIDQVTFGRDGQHEYVLQEDYPDFEINYAPYLWLSAPYDESSEYHLDPVTMHNPNLNRRQHGFEYRFSSATTYPVLKQWLLTHADRLRGTGGFNRSRVSGRR